MKKKNQLNRTYVICQYNCPHEDCMLRNINYIGSTTTTLSRRRTIHLINCAIKEHIPSQRLSILTKDNIVNNAKVLHMKNDTFRLLIHEAMLVKFKNPSFN